MLLHTVVKVSGAVHVPEGEVPERMLDAPHGVQDVHRSLHDVRQMAPAGSPHPVRLAVDVDAFAAEVERHRAVDYPHRRADGAGEGLDQRSLAARRFAGEAVDLVPPHDEADIVDGTDLAFDPIMLVDVVGLETIDC